MKRMRTNKLIDLTLLKKDYNIVVSIHGHKMVKLLQLFARNKQHHHWNISMKKLQILTPQISNKFSLTFVQ
jgi:hypothetical protein